MPIDRPTLEAAIRASGGAAQPDDQVLGLLAKLTALEATGRYGQLLASVVAANDKSNFLALLFEATFAHQFESGGMPLAYEVKQVDGQTSSVDFRLAADAGNDVYFELRLLQQAEAIAADIADQLSAADGYAVKLDGKGERKEVFRLQSTILQKVQQRDGTPTKFLKTTDGVVNIVVVAVSDVILGTADAMDCLLAMCGDPAVPEHCRRGVFGLFQVATPDDGLDVQARSASYAHIRATLHGVLFAFRPKGAGALDYRLEQLIVWNRHLIDEGRAQALTGQVVAALPPLA